MADPLNRPDSVGAGGGEVADSRGCESLTDSSHNTVDCRGKSGGGLIGGGLIGGECRLKHLLRGSKGGVSVATGKPTERETENPSQMTVNQDRRWCQPHRELFEYFVGGLGLDDRS